MKKSNHPNQARELIARFRTGGRLVYGRTLKIPASEQYQKIINRSIALYWEHGRQKAVDYLTYNRAWLLDYTGLKDLPSSGAILDDLINRKFPYGKRTK